MKPFKPVKTAVIGCGMISEIYLKNCCALFNVLEVVGCSDIIPERSAKRAEQFSIQQMTNEEIFSDPEIELVINLTYHTSHYPVSRAALLAGKHVYSEKMIGISFEEGQELVKLAKEKNLAFCAAPDTFLGASLQTARTVIDAGLIGTPVAANAILARGYHHERWKKEPERRFAFCPGGGIIYDVGCYYLTALVNLLGPVRRVCGFSQIREANGRRFMNPLNPQYGEIMPIETTNNLAGTLEFQNGVLCSLLTTSESGAFNNSFILYGTEGRLVLSDPNEFEQSLLLTTKAGAEQIVPSTHSFRENCRGLGAADMAYAIRNGRKPRANGENALHTLEAAEGLVRSCETNTFHVMQTPAERARPLRAGYTEYPEMVLDID